MKGINSTFRLKQKPNSYDKNSLHPTHFPSTNRFVQTVSSSNNAARLVCKSSKFEHVSPLLHSLHWLPISDRIDYKISSLTHSAICGTGPEYLSELVQIYTPSRPLRSSSDTRLLCIPSVRTKTYGQQSFSYQAPTTWNNLPAPLRHTESVTSFKTSLKTHLFSH